MSDLNVKGLLPGEADDTSSKLASIFQTALSNNSSSEASSSIDSLYEAAAASDKGAEDFLWTLWSLYIQVGKIVSADDPRQDTLVQIVKELAAKRDDEVTMWNQKTRVWTELPMLAPCMRDAWNESPRYNETKEDNETVTAWINVNAFAARLLATHLVTWDNFALWALRSALEREPQNDRERDASLLIAHAWVAYAGKDLKDRVNSTRELDEEEKRMFKAGQLFEAGEPGLTQKRWDFWRQRIETLSGAADSDVKSKTDKTVETMKTL
ncbi:uncharacterized protein F5Z01DRAFT_692216 [Emericellopsis atlantica]|uniref:Uncharacterized protein n=1 Tax=Emericellopsis atlantica TaxID=2614577 RepID=A0A9P7ZGX2_9HYPO|nr:uncharacterized protein F5Z01DRAFT_692216 [Emericellopsis atlantica]KAG9251462.1 hypothetical protein F5Z01DRAFT_692216 [Emericellopsis atlantica]